MGRQIALVGFWEITRDLPFTDPRWASAEIWSLNHNWPYLPKDRWDRWIDIHDPAWSATKGLKPEVWADQESFLKKKHGKPIFMQRHYEDYPDSVAYPLADVVKRFGRRYFTSAMAYLIALALYEGCDEIGLFGADMRGDEEYAMQRPCAEYWLGRAEGMGIKVFVPELAGVLNPDGMDYGYDEDTSAWVEMRRALAERIHLAKADRENFLVAAAKAHGKRDVLAGLMNGHFPDPAGPSPKLAAGLARLHEAAEGEYHTAIAQHYGYEAVLQDNHEWLRRIDQRRRGGGVL